MTKEQLAAAFVRILGKSPTNGAVANGYVSDWAKGYVAMALEWKLISASDNYATQASREDLVNGIYGTLQQHGQEEVKVSLLLGKQLGAKSLYVNLNQHVDPSDIQFSVTMDGAVVQVTAEPDALNGYVFNFPQKLKAGSSYTISASSSSLALDVSSVKIIAQQENATSLQFINSSDTLPQSKEVILPFQVKNQVGEAMQIAASDLTMATSADHAVLNTELQAVVLDTSPYSTGYGFVISLYMEPFLIVTKSFYIGSPAQAVNVENLSLHLFMQLMNMEISLQQQVQ